jgi:hypothetical protein
VLVNLLVEFLFRLTFGIAVAMAGTSSREVTSGFFRVHLWVLMGMQTLAALALFSGEPVGEGVYHYPQFCLAVTAAVASYLGAVFWLYDGPRPGKAAIVIVAACVLAGCCLPLHGMDSRSLIFNVADRLTSGLVLGFITTAMLLGHWYLNTPTMKLAPLKRLLFWLVAAVLLRMVVCAIGVDIHLFASAAKPSDTWFVFLALRWLSGLFGVLLLTFLAWQTLKIPNTQSATGILYAAVVLAFIGELTSQLLSGKMLYPV